MSVKPGFASTIVAAALALSLSGAALAQQPKGPGPGPGMGPGMMGGYGAGQGYGPGYGPGMMGGYGAGMMGGAMMGLGRAMWSLDLNDNQRKEILGVEDELRKKNWDLTGKMQDEMAKLRSAYLASSGSPDRAAVSAAYKRLGELRQQRVENSLDAAERIEKALTPEQRAQLTQQARRSGSWWMEELLE